MSSLQDSLKQINNLGATVVAITPESIDNIEITKNKTNASFHIIYDKNHKIMDKYKVTYNLSATKNTFYKMAGININKASGNTDRALPVTATYIINKERKIVGSHFDKQYSKRMTIKNILKILNANK